MVPGDTPAPKPLADRLGVRPGMSVVFDRLDDASLAAAVAARDGRVTRRRGPGTTDMIITRVADPGHLARLTALRRSIHDRGAVWVVFPRGRADLRDTDVMAAARAAGLVDNKVVRFNETDTAVRLVVPVALRAATSR